MNTISRDCAICMFYHQDYDKAKATELLYKDDPNKPFLLYANSIKADPYTYLKYQKITEAPGKNNQIEVETKKIGKLLTKKKTLCIFDYSYINFLFSQSSSTHKFLNMASLPVSPNNEEAYVCKGLSMNNILNVVWKYSDLFGEQICQKV